MSVGGVIGALRVPHQVGWIKIDVAKRPLGVTLRLIVEMGRLRIPAAGAEASSGASGSRCLMPCRSSPTPAPVIAEPKKTGCTRPRRDCPASARRTRRPATAPSAAADPEAFVRYAQAKIEATTNGDDLEATWNDLVEPARADLFPSDVDDLMSIYRKQEVALNA